MMEKVTGDGTRILRHELNGRHAEGRFTNQWRSYRLLRYGPTDYANIMRKIIKLRMCRVTRYDIGMRLL